MGIPSGADVGYEIPEEPFVILLDVYAALLLGGIQGVGDALFIVLYFNGDKRYFSTYVNMLRFPLKVNLANACIKAQLHSSAFPSRWVTYLDSRLQLLVCPDLIGLPFLLSPWDAHK